MPELCANGQVIGSSFLIADIYVKMIKLSMYSSCNVLPPRPQRLYTEWGDGSLQLYNSSYSASQVAACLAELDPAVAPLVSHECQLGVCYISCTDPTKQFEYMVDNGAVGMLIISQNYFQSRQTEKFHHIAWLTNSTF